MKLQRVLALVVLFIAHASCGKKDVRKTPTPLPQRTEKVVVPPGVGLAFRLLPGEGQKDTKPQKIAKTHSLGAGETEALLKRLPPITAAEQKAFALRASSLRPPIAGKTVLSTFPPPITLSAPKVDLAQQSLKVLRGLPRGEVTIAKNLSVTFSQPMVAITSHADTIKDGVPVRIKPQAEGTWRWVGTQTLLFEPKPRLAMATNYQVSVAQGTKAASGAVLAAEERWTFSTPAPRVLNYYPANTQQKLDPLLFVAFDQRIDPDKVLALIALQGGEKRLALRRASDTEIAADPQLSAMVTNAKRSDTEPSSVRWIAFRATERLEPDTSYNVTVPAGTPSAEGPLTSKTAKSWSFRTYAPLRVQDHNCKLTRNCRPGQGLYVTFNNNLDVEAFDPKTITVRPKIEEMRVVANYRSITIVGKTKGQTRYAVGLPAALRDEHGQTLGSTEVVSYYFGSADPQLRRIGGFFRVLDPDAKQTVKVGTINHDYLDVQIYQVKGSDWHAFAEFYQRGIRETPPAKPPGVLKRQQRLRIKGQKDEWVDTEIDLSRFLSGGHGQTLVVIKQTPFPLKPWERQWAAYWVQSTELAVDALVDHGKLLAWVTELKTGKPVANASVKIISGKPSNEALPQAKTTNAKGLAVFDLPNDRADRPRLLLAQKGSDQVLLPERSYLWGSSTDWIKTAKPGKQLTWYVFDDRQLYKPKEEVSLKGWVRAVDMGGSGVSLIDAATQLSYEVIGPRGNKVGKGTATLGKLGGFDLKFKLPDAVNLGRARVQLRLSSGPWSGSSHYHFFQIQEFRKPEFSVSTSVDPGPHLVGGSAESEVSASYYAGGPLPNAEVSWAVSASPGFFSPPNQSDFQFGDAAGIGIGFRINRGILGLSGLAQDKARPQHQVFSAHTGGRGTHRLQIAFDAIEPPRPYNVVAAAAVQDVNRQTWRSSSNILVHPAEHYVGLKTKVNFVNRGTPLDVQAIVADIAGKRLSDRAIAMRASRLQWVFNKGQWTEEEKDEQRCEIRSKQDAVKCSFATKKGGRYRIVAEIKDSSGRLNRTTITRWVSGGQAKPQQRVALESIQLVTDKKEYQPGERVKLLIQAPFDNGEGLMTIRRVGLKKTQRFSLSGSSATLELPVSEDDYPGYTVQVDVVGAAQRVDARGNPLSQLPKRPAFASGTTTITVPPLRRKLSLTVSPQSKRIAPGQQTEIAVVVRDAAGKPQANAEIALVVVDEAILALTGYRLPDPIARFYPWRYAGVRDYRLRGNVDLADPVELAKDLPGRAQQPLDDAMGEREEGLIGKGAGSARLAATTGAAPPAPSAAPASESKSVDRSVTLKKSKLGKPAGQAAASDKVQLRQDFRALALFEPRLQSDDRGVVRIKFKAPDSLTRYRITAVAVADAKYYGLGEAALTASLPLGIRPSPPRFLNYGDRFELPIVLQNQTDKPLAVKVAVRGSNLQLTQGNGRGLELPANDRLEVRFPARAVEAGTARLQIAVQAGTFSDAAEVTLPVWTPATTEAFATYGTIDKSGAATVQPVKFPSDVISSFGGLEIGTSSTALSALTDAVIYLSSYPYQCAEQMSSRLVSIAALRDVLAAFKAPGLPAPKDLLAQVNLDIKRLSAMQNADGGFPFWIRGYPSWPFLSAHVTHALVRAKAKGFAVPPRMLQNALSHLRYIERYIPSNYGPPTRRAIIAYSLYVRAQADDVDGDKARRLLAELTQDAHRPELEGVAWVYPVLSKAGAKEAVAKIRRLIGNRVNETAATAQFTSSYSDGAHLILHSSRRLDALLLEGMMLDQPKHDLIVKLVRGLLGHRKRGRWGNTQENAWVLLALDRYFHTYEGVTPNFVAQAWLGNSFAGQQKFHGRTTDRQLIEVPMQEIAKQGTADLILAKRGPGRLYYRIGMRYAPKDLRPPAADHGFTVTRRYEAVDEPADVRQESDGTWRVRAGARVRVVLTMVAVARRYHVALVDPLPAGLEPLNPALRGSTAPTTNHGLSLNSSRAGYLGRYGGGYRYWWWGPWYEHQNLRDERAEAFTSLLRPGVHSYSYTARATTPGDFVVPPPKAEEMYHPETFGRGAGDRLVVE